MGNVWFLFFSLVFCREYISFSSGGVYSNNWKKWNRFKGATMKTTAFILNWLVVCVCCLASSMMNMIVKGLAYLFLDGKAMPSITVFFLNNAWLLWAILLSWGVATVCLRIKKCAVDILPFHTSASVFLGLLVFLLHFMAGILPFLSLVTCACGYNLYDPHP